ncbi:CRISPR-associated endonuclease Cas2 [Candidatus Giovannonibacteria bacterium]|nr:CRISPR-associated endonuclease Cas2 [Candidatus Giovannonibacteria bacterium]
MARYSIVKEKILLLLLGGAALLLAYNPKKQLRVIEQISKEWKKINRRKLYYGKKRALVYSLDQLELKKERVWDKKWRIVIFDIPEKKKRGREALRLKLKELGFKELQKSIFAFPYKCKDEIDFVVEVFELRQYVRFIETSNLFHDADLRLHFNLV